MTTTAPASPRSEISVRRAIWRDADAVRGLLNELMVEHNGWQPANFRRNVLGLTEAIFQTWLDVPYEAHLVAEDGQRVLGYISANRFRQMNNFVYDKQMVHVTQIVVTREHRRGGIGRKLLAAIETWAQEWGAEQISLHMNPFNETGRKFYDNLGYALMTETRAKTLKHVVRMEETGSSMPDAR